MRRLLVFAVVLLVGCGGSEVAPFEPGVYELGWHETARLGGRPVMEFEVKRVRLERGHWEVDGSFTNRSAAALAIEVPENVKLPKREWTWLGIATLPSEAIPAGTPKILHAETYEPPLPGELAPGATWSGTFGGPGTPRLGTYLRVTFGLFDPRPPVPAGLTLFGWVTDHTVKLVRTPE